MLARLIVVSLLLASLLPVASAAPDPTAPGVTRWVKADLDLAQPTLTRIDVTGTLDVHKHRVGTRTYTAQGASEQYQAITTFDEGSGPEFVSNMESAVRTGLETILSQAFPTATRTITKVDVVESTLSTTAGRTDAFEPPIRVDIAATIDRTREDVGLGSLSDAAVAAAFASGAVVKSDLTFSADPGYDLTFTLRKPVAPAGVSFSQLSTGEVAIDGSSVRIALPNAAGASVLTRPVTLQLSDASATAPLSEELTTTVDVTLGAFERGVTTLPLTATITTQLASLDIAERFPDVLPASVTLDYLSADGLRALRQAGAVTDAHLASADAAFLDTLTGDLREVLGDGATATGGLSRDDLQADAAKPYDGAPPVQLLATASGGYALPGENAEDADLALDIGATIRFDLTLVSSKGETVYRLHPPAGAEFIEPRGGTVTADGKTATFTIAAGSAPTNVGLALQKSDITIPEREDADVGVVIDLRDLDIQIGKALAGDFGTILADVTVTGNLGTIAIPDEVKATLGESVDLAFLTSDAVRLLLDRGVLTQERLDELETTLLDAVKENLGGALGSDIEVTGGFLDASLDKTLVTSTVSGERPIVFEARASFAKSLSGSSPTGAAMALYTIPQTFTFPRVQGLDTAYTVVLPRGLAVTGLESSGGTAEQTTWSDGRDAFIVKPGDEGSATTTVSMSVTPTFVLAKFWPIVLGAVVLLVLIVGTPIAIVILRRRKAE